MRTPWGKAQTVELIAEGITKVTTAGHGGIKLDRKHNAKVPEYMRAEGGWYEEDCDWSIVATVFPEHFTEKAREHAEASLRNWCPEMWEQFYGRVLGPGESYTKDQVQFREDNRGNYVVISAVGKETVDGGRIVEFCAALGGNRNFDTPKMCGFMSPEEYEKRGRFGYVLSPEQVKECSNG